MIVVGWKCVRARVSAAEEAALEVALRLAERGRDREIVVVTVGGPSVEPVLREALAVGATRAVRIDAADGLTSSAVAEAIAGVATGATWVVCADASADRGTGAVPAYLAAELAAAQALGLVDVDVDVKDHNRVRDHVSVVRRLDGGRRELLSVTPPAVLSVEGAVARLRRASLPAELDAHHAVIEVVPGPTGPVEASADVGPYRPRPRQRPAPSGDPLHRIQELTSTSGAPPVHAEVVTLEPAAAAGRILAALGEWGYLPHPVRE
jgi:electron transfer flavoprotein beta subunit